MKSFQTPKNKFVIYPELKQIWKYFQNPQEYQKEKEIYQYSPSFAPKLCGLLPQQNLIKLQLLNAKTSIEIEPKFQKIAQLFAQLHRLNSPTICLCDTNPRNILYEIDLKRYFLIDFSDWQYQPPEYDLINFLLFWASIYSPKSFAKAATDFLAAYQKIAPIDGIFWQKRLPQAETEFDQRRARFNRKKAIEGAAPKENRKFMEKVAVSDFCRNRREQEIRLR